MALITNGHLSVSRRAHIPLYIICQSFFDHHFSIYYFVYLIYNISFPVIKSCRVTKSVGILQSHQEPGFGQSFCRAVDGPIKLFLVNQLYNDTNRRSRFKA